MGEGGLQQNLVYKGSRLVWHTDRGLLASVSDFLASLWLLPSAVPESRAFSPSSQLCSDVERPLWMILAVMSKLFHFFHCWSSVTGCLLNSLTLTSSRTQILACSWSVNHPADAVPTVWGSTWLGLLFQVFLLGTAESVAWVCSTG